MKIKNDNLYILFKLLNEEKKYSKEVNNIDSLIEELENNNEAQIIIFTRKDFRFASNSNIEEIVKKYKGLKNIFTADLFEILEKLLENHNYKLEKVLERFFIGKYFIYLYNIKGNMNEETLSNS